MTQPSDNVAPGIMRHHRIGLALALLLVAGCGARTDIPDGEELDGSVVQDATEHDSTLPDSPAVDVIVKDVVTEVAEDVVTVDVTEEPPPPECVPSCTQNFQCALTCPPVQNGIWCCDEQVGTCYAFSGQLCPPQIIDAGFD